VATIDSTGRATGVAPGLANSLINVSILAIRSACRWRDAVARQRSEQPRLS
jgi:hypothetical protein